MCFVFFFQAEDGIRDLTVTGVQTCALPISPAEPLRQFSHVHVAHRAKAHLDPAVRDLAEQQREPHAGDRAGIDRKSTRLNSSHSQISYAVFCLKKKNITTRRRLVSTG